MGRGYFEFQRFVVWQQQTTLRVCSDACVLGALARHETPERILDVGTGTGLLALMLAQRYPCPIDAIELDVDAAAQATHNFQHSPWASRLRLFHDDALTWRSTTTMRYSMIVCNPPFFTTHSPSPKLARYKAMHAPSLPWRGLLTLADALLDDEGTFWCMMPPESQKKVESLCVEQGLQIIHRTFLRDRESKPLFRLILGAQKSMEPLISETRTQTLELYEEGTGRRRSEAHASLMRDYYL